MMLWPVELNASARPWPGEADQRGLDDGLVINQIVVVRLVLQRVNAPAEFRQDQRADEFVLDPNRLPFPIYRFFCDAIRERQWIHFPAAALIYALFQNCLLYTSDA